ncbi:MAG: ParB/RepB/Spo0J family partition protein [Desulfobacterales bacterium]|nr:ParB/RepB/Spo0J family partition protein [Desulfobacterales bacterium]
MPQLFKTISLDRIDLSDDTYRVTTQSDPAELARSIGAVGVLSPPIVKQRRGRWSVVCGFRRMAACRLLGRNPIACRILSDDSDFLTCAKIAVADNASQRRLNPVELSRAYRLLSRALSFEELPIAAGEIGLPDGQELIEKLWDLCTASAQIQRGIVDERIALPVALELIRMPEAETTAFAELLASVPLSLNRQREALALIREIARREDLDFTAVVHSPELAGIAQDPETALPQKGKALLSALKRRRFPSRFKFEEAFEQKRRQLPLGEGMSLLPPPNFEGSRYVLQLSFHSADQIAEQLDRGRKVAQSKMLQEILSAG